MNNKSIFFAIKSGFSYLKESNDPFKSERLETLNLLKDYVQSGVYSSYSGREVLLSNIDEPPKKLAKLMDISEAGVRQAKKRLSEEVYNILGNDIIDRILYNKNIKKCSLAKMTLNNLKSLGECHNRLLLDECSSSLRNSFVESSEDQFPLSDCILEMQFLRLYSVKYFSEIVSKINREKLIYVLRVLERDAGTVDMQHVALNYILSEEGFPSTNTERTGHEVGVLDALVEQVIPKLFKS